MAQSRRFLSGDQPFCHASVKSGEREDANGPTWLATEGFRTRAEQGAVSEHGRVEYGKDLEVFDRRLSRRGVPATNRIELVETSLLDFVDTLLPEKTCAAPKVHIPVRRRSLAHGVFKGGAWPEKILSRAHAEAAAGPKSASSSNGTTSMQTCSSSSGSQKTGRKESFSN